MATAAVMPMMIAATTAVSVTRRLLPSEDRKPGFVHAVTKFVNVTENGIRS
jgi:hypothetical protein